MEAPYNLLSTKLPEKDMKINAVDKHSKYTVRVKAPADLSVTLFTYAENFVEAAHLITEFIFRATLNCSIFITGSNSKLLSTMN